MSTSRRLDKVHDEKRMNDKLTTKAPIESGDASNLNPEFGRLSDVFVAALKLHRFFPNKEKMVALLRKATANCGRQVGEQELWDAINNSQPIAEGTTPLTLWTATNESDET